MQGAYVLVAFLISMDLIVGAVEPTSSMESLMDPTLKAPMAAKEKKPCCQEPERTALSLRANRPGIFLAAQGATVSSSPARRGGGG